MANVRIGSWRADGGAGMDGFFIEDGGLVGLTGGVGVKRNIVAREQAHGDYRVPSFKAARFVTVSGPCWARSAEELERYARLFTGLFAEGEQTVVFDTPGGPLWAVGELASDPEFDVTLWGQRASWQLPLYFRDPRLFGDAHTLAATAGNPVVAINRGNFAATSIITVTGVASGYTITGPGGLTRSIVSPITTGNPHVIDMATGYVRNNSGFLEGVSSGSTWAVPAGGTATQTISSGSGSVSMSVETKATFI